MPRYASRTPVTGFSVARPAWPTPPTVLKSPAMNSRLPDIARSFTAPLIAGGRNAVRAPVASETWARFRDVAPLMLLNEPPRDTELFGPATTALTTPLSTGANAGSTAPVAGLNANTYDRASVAPP